MLRKQLFTLLLLTLSLSVIVAACRRNEEISPTETPPPTQTAVATTEPTPPSAPTEQVRRPVNPADIDWSPQVIYSSPAPGEEAILDGAITVRFDQPMNQALVEAAFAVFPEQGRQAVNGVFSWPRPDTVLFTPEATLKRAENYRVRIDDSAAGLNGRTLPGVVELALQTVGFLEVGQAIPGDGVDGVQTDNAITVLFNRPVVPLVSTAQQSGLPQPLTIEPAVSGQGQWVSTSIYRFVPDEPLAGATRYEVTVEAGLEDMTGGVLADDYRWSFTTLRPSVVSIEPPSGTAGFDPTQPISITFNMPMEQAGTQAAVSLDPATPVTFEWSEDGRVLTLIPTQNLQLETRYRLTVGQSARSANGQAPLDRETNSSFTTVPFPRIVNTFPRRGEEVPAYQQGFSVEFASPMDLSTVKEKIRIQPQPEEVRYFTGGDIGNYVQVSFDMLRNTEYIITVPGTAADPYGNTLGEDYSWRFRTGGYQPLVSLNLAPRISQLSTSYPSDVTVVYRNVSRADATLTRLALPLGFLIESYRINETMPSGEQIWSRSIPAAAEGDTVVTSTLSLADGGTLATGVYFLSVNAPEADPNDRYWQNRSNLLIVADTNLVVKEMFDSVHVWATDLASGEPAAGRQLTLYDYDGIVMGTAVTDANGLASFEYTSDVTYLRGVLVVSNEPGAAGFGIGTSTWNETARPWQFNINYTSGKEPPLFGYIYTDRPIYRPGDTVYFRGIVRHNQYGRYGLPEPQTLSLTVQEDYYSGSEPFRQEVNVTLDENGNFSGEFILSEEARLVNYQMFFENNDIQGFRSFTVAEYRRPEFLVTVTADKPEALRDEPVRATVEASYFFGGPATDLSVQWRVFQERHFLSYEGPYSFTNVDDFYFYDPYGGSGFYQEELLRGEGQTDSNGRFVIRLPADLLQDIEDGSRQVTIEATIHDISEFAVASRTNIIYHPAEVYVGVAPADYLGQSGLESEVDLVTVDWDGQPVSNRAVELVFYQREWDEIVETQFGQTFTRWEPTDIEVGRAAVTTDAQGRATTGFVPPEGGSYKIEATVTDDDGRSQTSSTFLWVADSDYVGWRTASRERAMDLVADRQSYQPGDTAGILVQSPFPGPVQAWVTVERGTTILEQRLVTLASNSDTINLPIAPDYAPNVFVTVVAVQGINENNRYADLRLGIVELPVSTEQLALNLTLTPQSDLLQPGETVTYDIRVTDYQGRPVQADLSLALVDLAVLTLKPDNAPPILEAFYSPQPYRSQIGASLFVSGEGLELEIPEEFFGGGGGGGGDEAAQESVALRDKSEEEDEEVRREFPDTAFWEAVVQTDENGRASVDIPLPDTTTTWRLSSKAATAASQVGQTSVDVVASLPLLIRPITPRFFTVGDVVELGAIINNTTESEMDVTVSLEAEGVVLAGGAEQGIVVPANGSRLVRWQVDVEDIEFADLTFRARSDEYSDATRPSFGVGPDQLIPVYRYDAEDIVGTSGVLEEAGRRVEAILLPAAIDTRRGEILAQLSPSLAAAVLDALDYLDQLESDPICAHGVIDQLLPNVATISALRLLDISDPELESRLEQLVQTDVARLAGLQKGDGGWGWCGAFESDPYLSAYILFGLLKAQEAGYETAVDQGVVDNALRYVERLIARPASLSERYKINQEAFYLYVLAEADQAVLDDVDELIDEHRALLDPYARAFLALAYELNGAAGSNNQRALLSDLNDSVILSATGAHWEDDGRDWRSLNSNIRGTAIVVDALARIEPDNALAPQAVRWLMAARQTNRWPSTQETVWSVLALSDWMAATGELNASFNYLVNVNLETLDEGSFTRTNVIGSRTLTVPIHDLVLEDVNFVEFQRGAGDGRLYYTLHLDSYIAAETVSAVDRGVIVQRIYYDADCNPAEETCRPIDRIEAGEAVRVELTVIAPHDLFYVIVEDPIPAGAEAVDPGLATSQAGAGGRVTRVDEDYRYGYWGWWYFNQIQFKDEKVVFSSNYLPAGTYQYSYTLQTTIPGQFQVMPAVAYQEFFPEVFGRSEGNLFTIQR